MAKLYKITRFCCLSGCCIYCHVRGNHGDTRRRERVLQADRLSEDFAKRMLKGWKQYEPTMELDCQPVD